MIIQKIQFTQDGIELFWFTQYAIDGTCMQGDRKTANHYTLEWGLVVWVFPVQPNYQWFSLHFDPIHGTSIQNQCTAHDHLNRKPFGEHAKMDWMGNK